MSFFDKLRLTFQEWIQKAKLSLSNLSIDDQILRLPSENIDDYYYDYLKKEWIYKQKITQIGFENTLNLIKLKIDNIETQNISMNTDLTNLQAIISDIANIEVQNITQAVDLTNLQAIISDIANIETQNIAMNTDLTNLQAIISDIANIETQNIAMSGDLSSLQAIISDIDNIETQNIAMSSDLSNLQAIITDISNIETQNISMSGDLTNLQAIISDIANIETQLISIQTTNATINTNIGTINTAISQINAHQVDIDLNIESVKDLDIDIISQVNKGTVKEATLANGNTDTMTYDSDLYLFNQMTFSVLSISNPVNITLTLKNKIGTTWITHYSKIHTSINPAIYIQHISFPAHPYIRVLLTNNTGNNIDFKYTLFFSKNISKQIILPCSIIPENVLPYAGYRWQMTTSGHDIGVGFYLDGNIIDTSKDVEFLFVFEARATDASLRLDKYMGATAIGSEGFAWNISAGGAFYMNVINTRIYIATVSQMIFPNASINDNDHLTCMIRLVDTTDIWISGIFVRFFLK